MLKKILSLTVIICFFLTSLGPLPQVHAGNIFGLPAPGTMINLSPAYEPVMIKGLTVHKDNPFLFDFIVDEGQDKVSGAPLKQEGEKLIKYFLASLAIPDKDVWVNLSPYEKNRMIPEVLGQTDMGRDLLEQDYILKQITASLIYPEKQLGKTFWDKVYAKSREMYGTTQIPVNTFNKVWIMADRAEVFEHNQTAFVVDSHLKVMLEEDYLALQKSSLSGGIPPKAGHAGSINRTPTNGVNALGSTIVRQLILPELEKEVNTGKNFANLRQIFNSIILSSWYKKNLKQALLNQIYADRSKVKGIQRNDVINSFKDSPLQIKRGPAAAVASAASQNDVEAIYQQYLKAYKKGVFNYIKENISSTGVAIPRKYFSGGMVHLGINPAETHDPAELAQAITLPVSKRLVDLSTLVSTQPINFNAAMTVVPSGASFTFEKKGHFEFTIAGLGEHGDTIKVVVTPSTGAVVIYQNHLGEPPSETTVPVAKNTEELLSSFGVPLTIRISYKTVRFTSTASAAREIKVSSETPFKIDAAMAAAGEAGSWGMEYINGPGDMMREIDGKTVPAHVMLRWKGKKVAFELVSLGKGPEIEGSSQVIKGSRYKITSIDGQPLEQEKFLEADLIFGSGNEGGMSFWRFNEDSLAKALDAAMGSVIDLDKLVYRSKSLDPRGVIYVLGKKGFPVGQGEAGTLRIEYNLKGHRTHLTWTKSGKGQAKIEITLPGAQRIATWSEAVGAINHELERLAAEAAKGPNFHRSITAPALPDRLRANPAMKATSYGGIDLNTSNGMQWKIAKDASGVEMAVDPALIARVRRQGIESLTLVIFRITPITSIWSLIGLPGPGRG